MEEVFMEGEDDWLCQMPLQSQVQSVREMAAAVFGNMAFTKNWQEENQDRTSLDQTGEECMVVKHVQSFKRPLWEGVASNVGSTGGGCGAKGDTLY